MPGFPVLHHLPKLAQTHVHWVRDVIQLSRPLLSPSPPAFYLFQHLGLFQWVRSSIRWPKYWSFSFSISPSSEYSGLISFRIDWFDFLAVQGTLKSFLQHHSSKASILWHSPFFMVQFSHPYMITGKVLALTRCTFVGKMMSLLFNMLSRWLDGKTSAYYVGDPGLIPGWGRSSGERNGNLFQYSCLENPMDRGAW